VSRLEVRCTDLAATVEGLNAQIDRSAKSEQEMEVRVGKLSRSLNESSSSGKGARDQMDRMHRALDNAEQEKKEGLVYIFLGLVSFCCSHVTFKSH
jgi:chromosome segregation ATPase